MKHYVYIVLCCSDNTFYTGYTTDLQRRIDEHNLGTKGAKYTRGRRPIKLMYFEWYKSKSKAMKREYQIKQMSQQEKKKLMFDNYYRNTTNKMLGRGHWVEENENTK